MPTMLRLGCIYLAEDNERASRFLEACMLMAAEDLNPLIADKNADLFE